MIAWESGGKMFILFFFSLYFKLNAKDLDVFNKLFASRCGVIPQNEKPSQ